MHDAVSRGQILDMIGDMVKALGENRMETGYAKLMLCMLAQYVKKMPEVMAVEQVGAADRV